MATRVRDTSDESVAPVAVDVAAGGREHVALVVARLVDARLLEHERREERPHLGVDLRRRERVARSAPAAGCGCGPTRWPSTGYTSSVVRRSPLAISVCTKTSAPARPRQRARAVASGSGLRMARAPAPRLPATSAAMRSASSSPRGAGWSVTRARRRRRRRGVGARACAASCAAASTAPAADATRGRDRQTRASHAEGARASTPYIAVSLYVDGRRRARVVGGQDSAVSVGSVPARNTSSITSGSSAYGSSPVFLSTPHRDEPGGREKSTLGLPVVGRPS